MKKIIFSISVLLALVWISCDPTIVFTTHQPEDVPIRFEIDDAYLGSFICESDSALVVIEKKVIYKKDWVGFTVPKNEIEENENFILSGEHLFVKDVGECWIYKIQNDTVFAAKTITDTLFNFEEGNHVLKSYRGYQFLNMKMADNRWEVMVLKLDEKNNVTFYYPNLPGEIEDLENITPVKDISSDDLEQYLITPTLVEFDQILDQKIVFQACDYFRRVIPPDM